MCLNLSVPSPLRVKANHHPGQRVAPGPGGSKICPSARGWDEMLGAPLAPRTAQAPGIDCVTPSGVGSSPRHEGSVLCCAVPHCTAQPCAPAADSDPQAAFSPGTVTGNPTGTSAGAQARAGGQQHQAGLGSRQQSSKMLSPFSVRDDGKPGISGDATGHRAPTRHVAVWGTVLSGCLWKSGCSSLNCLCLLFTS